MSKLTFCNGPTGPIVVDCDNVGADTVLCIMRDEFRVASFVTDDGDTAVDITISNNRIGANGVLGHLWGDFNTDQDLSYLMRNYKYIVFGGDL